MCVWSSITYGIISIGATAVAMHLRKLLRVHQKGHSNESVLRSVDMALLPFLCQQAERQALSLQLDQARSAILREQEDRRSSQMLALVRSLHQTGLQSLGCE